MASTKKTPQGLEKRLGWMILLLLLGIALGVFKAQYELNPAVRIKALPDAAPAPKQPPAAANQGHGSVLAKIQNWPWAGPLEAFTSDTLADKIDGKADLYLANGFTGLECRRFHLKDADTEWFEVFAYDMGRARQAFTVFSLQHRSGGRGLDLTPNAYETENALYLAHGQFYLEVIASLPAAAALEQIKAFAAQWIQNTPVSNQDMPEPALFPAAQRVADSLKLIGTDAFGCEGLRDIFTTQYRLGTTDLTAFLSMRATAAEAQSLANEYANFLLAYGGENLEPPAGNPGLRVIQIIDTYEIIFSQDRILAGVHGAEDLQQGLALSKTLYDHISRHEK